MRKIFVVGCPRSGTTLLQSLLASHSEIVSFPETHLFSKTIPLQKILRLLKVYGKAANKERVHILRDFGVHVNEVHTRVRLHEWTHILLSSLDQIGKAYSKNSESIILEKTPRHLHYIDLIQKAEASTVFIHLIRNGEDVVASLYEATANSPDKWSGDRSIKKCIFWWNRSIRLSRKYVGEPNHVFVRYENLVEDTETVLRYLTRELDLSFEENMLADYSNTAQNVINVDESWKSKNISTDISASDKFLNLSVDLQNQIKKGLIKFDYNQIDISRFDSAG